MSHSKRMSFCMDITVHELSFHHSLLESHSPCMQTEPDLAVLSSVSLLCC